MVIYYFIDAMQGMPGRKALIVMTPRIKQKRGLALNIQDWKPSSVLVRNMDTALYHLADKALRAGVVVHTMDIAGVQLPDFIDVTYSGEYNPEEDIPLEPGYVDDPEKGYMLRHHMHLEGKDLSIVEGKNGTH